MIRLSSLYRDSIKILVPFIMALSTSLIDLFPGGLLAASSNFLADYKWLIMIYPPLISLRGVVGGIYSGRLATSLHLGSILPYFRRNSDEFYTLLSSLSFLYLVSAYLITSLSTITLVFVFGNGINVVYNVLLVVCSTLLLSQVMIVITFLFAKISYIRGWDPDIITYPITSSLGDLFITLLFLFSSYIIVYLNFVFMGVIFTILLFFMPFLYLSLGFEYDRFRVEVRESIISIFVAGLIVSVTGYFFRGMESFLKLNPIIYFIYPAVLTAVGDGGSILGSLSTTKLALVGGLDINETVYVYLPVLNFLIGFIFFAYGSMGFLLFSSPFDFTIILKLVLSGLISLNIISVFSIFTAYLTFLRGLDPDHFVIPIESSLADNITTFILYLFFFIL